MRNLAKLSVAIVAATFLAACSEPPSLAMLSAAVADYTGGKVLKSYQTYSSLANRGGVFLVCVPGLIKSGPGYMVWVEASTNEGRLGNAHKETIENTTCNPDS